MGNIQQIKLTITLVGLHTLPPPVSQQLPPAEAAARTLRRTDGIGVFTRACAWLTEAVLLVDGTRDV